MYEAQLEKRLYEIFGVKKVVLDGFKLGKDQDVLFVDVYKCFNSFPEGAEMARVTGKVEIASQKGKLKHGWMHKKINKAPNKDFYFVPTEELIKFEYNGDSFTKYGIEFVYFYKGEFNPPVTEITDISITVEAN